jgi:hypothetical protein
MTRQHGIALTTSEILSGVDPQYETENRVVWNDLKRRNEEQILVYEVSWIPELGVWRRFLRTRKTN